MSGASSKMKAAAAGGSTKPSESWGKGCFFCFFFFFFGMVGWQLPLCCRHDVDMTCFTRPIYTNNTKKNPKFCLVWNETCKALEPRSTSTSGTPTWLEWWAFWGDRVEKVESESWKSHDFRQRGLVLQGWPPPKARWKLRPCPTASTASRLPQRRAVVVPDLEVWNANLCDVMLTDRMNVKAMLFLGLTGLVEFCMVKVAES